MMLLIAQTLTGIALALALLGVGPFSYSFYMQNKLLKAEAAAKESEDWVARRQARLELDAQNTKWYAVYGVSLISYAIKIACIAFLVNLVA